MRPKALFLTFALTAVLAFSGCADDDGNGDPDPTTTGPGTTNTATTTTTSAATTTTTTTPSPGQRDPVTWDIDVQDNAFAPADLTIQVGDTVRWTQSGANPHTVTDADGSFDSHPDCQTFLDAQLGDCMASGDTFEHTFASVDEVTYFCRLHGDAAGSGMAGTLSVLATFDGTP